MVGGLSWNNLTLDTDMGTSTLENARPIGWEDLADPRPQEGLGEKCGRGVISHLLVVERTMAANEMDALKARVLSRVEATTEEAIELLADLVKAGDADAPDDTRRVMDTIIRKVETFTRSYEVISVEETAPNIFITLNRGARPQLLYNGHLDIVPAGNRQHWEVDPFAALIRGNSMYGRGVADMKGGVGAMLMATKVLQLEEVPLQGSLVTNFVSDEEKNGALGAGYLMDNGYYSPDMVVVGEITNGNRIALAEKGGVLFRLRTRGRSAHASTPWTGVNAIEKMAAILHHIATGLIPALKARPSGQLPPASMSFGTIRGGVATNVVADACDVLIDRRTLPGESVESVAREIQDAIDEAQRADPEIDASLEVVWTASAFETSPDQHICRIARRTVDELGLESDFVGYEQLSDARFFAEKGIPVIIIGPGMAQLGHSPNERLELDQYVDAIKIYALLAINALVTATA